MSIFVMVVAMAFVIYCALKGLKFELMTMIAAAVVMMLNGHSFMTGMKEIYLPAAANYFKNYVFLIFASLIFANLMRESGAAMAIARGCIKLVDKFPNHKPLATIYVSVLITAILSAGGVNFFVIMFIMVPICRDLFREMDIPWHMVANMTLGFSSFTLGGLPGMTSQNNIVAANLLGTTVRAAPTLGFIGSGVMALVGALYIWFVVKQNEKRKEKFLPSGKTIMEANLSSRELPMQVPFIMGILPPIVVLVLLNGVKLSPEVSMLGGSLVCFALMFKNVGKLVYQCTGDALTSSIATIGSVSMVAAFGTAVTSMVGYTALVRIVSDTGLPIMVLIWIVLNVCAFVTGNGSVAVNAGIPSIMSQIQASGINLEVAHRIATISSNGLDATPHSSAVIIATRTMGLKVSEAYRYWFFHCVIGPTIAAWVCMIFANMGIV
jgi:H+/gluconate symporter-like permease